MSFCEHCQKNPANLTVTELLDPEEGAAQPGPAYVERRLCETCAQAYKLPQGPVTTQVVTQDLWKLMQKGKAKLRVAGPRCPDCGMSLEEIRRRGKVGCARDYEVFAEHLTALLERMHGATNHVGRLPGLGERELERINRLGNLRQQLEHAIREENYEFAAGLRDEIRLLETEQGGNS